MAFDISLLFPLPLSCKLFAGICCLRNGRWIFYHARADPARPRSPTCVLSAGDSNRLTIRGRLSTRLLVDEISFTTPRKSGFEPAVF